MVSETEAHYVN